MRPDVGVSKPASMRSSVLLPQPDEPSSAKISPLADVEVDVVDSQEAVEVLDDVDDLRKAGATAARGCLARQPGL